MTMKNTTGNDPVDAHLQPIATKLQKSQLDKIVVQTEQFAFRDKHELEEASLKQLAEDIASCGINTPLLVKDCDEKGFLMLDGHRRPTALQSLLKDGVEECDADSRVPEKARRDRLND